MAKCCPLLKGLNFSFFSCCLGLLTIFYLLYNNKWHVYSFLLIFLFLFCGKVYILTQNNFINACFTGLTVHVHFTEC